MSRRSGYDAVLVNSLRREDFRARCKLALNVKDRMLIAYMCCKGVGKAGIRLRDVPRSDCQISESGRRSYYNKMDIAPST